MTATKLTTDARAKRDADDDRALTTAQFARRFGITVHSALALLGAGVLAGVDVRRPGASRPRWRIMPEAIEAFIRVRGSKPAQAKPARRRAAKSDSNVIEFFK